MNAALKYDIIANDDKEFEQWVSAIEEDIKRDPFALGRIIGVKGLTKVNHKVALSDYAERLVCDHAIFRNDQYELALDMVSQDEQNELARLYIESIDREIEYACYGTDESINSDFLCALLSMLQNNCDETRENFATVTRNNILAYYKDSLQEVLNDACDNHLHAQLNEQGFQFYQDMDHGDTFWSR